MVKELQQDRRKRERERQREGEGETEGETEGGRGRERDEFGCSPANSDPAHRHGQAADAAHPSGALERSLECSRPATHQMYSDSIVQYSTVCSVCEYAGYIGTDTWDMFTCRRSLASVTSVLPR